jgi:hypothetical protein
MKAQIEIVTPSQAKEYLERRLPNRNLSEHTALRYATDMRDGRWLNNGQGIVFDEQGNLIDGQHRCRAILISGCSISMLVVRGAPARAMETMDTGRARSLSDVLHIRGIKNSVVMSATARICWNYAAGVGFHYTPSKATLLSFVIQHPHLERAVATVEFAKRAGMVTRSPMAALLALATAGDKLIKEAQEFTDGVVYGEGLWKGDARLTLRNWIASNRSDKTFTKQHVSEPTFGALIRAWNAFAQGRELSLIKLPPNINRDTAPVFGFYQIDWADVPDLAESRAEGRLENLARAHQANAAARQAPAAG